MKPDILSQNKGRVMANRKCKGMRAAIAKSKCTAKKTNVEKAHADVRTKPHDAIEMQKSPVARSRKRSQIRSCRKNFQQQLLDSMFLQTRATATKKKPSEKKRANRMVAKTTKNNKKR